ncbi:hypothetical protein [Sphingomonas sp. M1A8_2b]
MFDLMLRYRRDCGGDPLLAGDRIPDPDGEGHFRLWAGEQVSGIEPEEDIYTVDEVFNGSEEELRAHAKIYPDRRPEVEAALVLLQQYRQRFWPRSGDSGCAHRASLPVPRVNVF